MKNYSLWNDIKKVKSAKILDKDLDVDVLIIGGGITGISMLYNLKNTNLKVALVERNKCGYGVTSKSTAKITYLQEKIYMNIRKFVNEEIASKYLKSQMEAVKMLRNVIEEENIDCDLKQVSSIIFTNEEDNIKNINEEYIFLKKALVDVKRIKKTDLDIKIKKGLEVNDTYVFHPLKFIDYFKNKYINNIYENTKVNNIIKENDYYICTTDKYKIKAKYVVIATHYPYFLFPFMMPLKSYIETSYIGAKKVKDLKNISAINIDNPCISLRYHNHGENNYLIYLYNSFKTSNINSINDNFLPLKKQNFEYIWSNNDIITNDYMPYIGSINSDNNMFIATGYNTWGFTNATLAGKIITDIILKQNNPYINLFSPKRKLNLSKVLRFPLDLSSNVKALIKSTKNNVNNTQVIYKKINNIDVAIYKDQNNKEHIVYNKCPHLKCGLVFNETEKTWDCLCHGSRFDIDGKCIEGPSNYDISFKEK